MKLLEQRPHALRQFLKRRTFDQQQRIAGSGDGAPGFRHRIGGAFDRFIGRAAARGDFGVTHPVFARHLDQQRDSLGVICGQMGRRQFSSWDAACAASRNRCFCGKASTTVPPPMVTAGE